MELIYLFLLLLVVATAITLTHPAMRDRLFSQQQPVRAYSPRREARMASSDYDLSAAHLRSTTVSAASIKEGEITVDKIREGVILPATRVRVDDPTPLFTQMLQSYRDQGIDIS